MEGKALMPTIEIEGVGDVEVDDSFMKLSPEDQNKTVEEIAGALRASAIPGNAEPAALPTVSTQAQEVFGLDPTMQKRGTILPVGVNKEGTPEFAVPQIGVDLMESFLLPGRAAQGETITPEEAAKFTLDLAAPAAARRLPGGLTARRATKKETIKSAASTKDLLAAGGAKFKEARAGGAKLSADEFVDFLSKTETTLNEEGVDQFTKSAFPKLSGVVDSLMARLGKEPNIRDLQIMRKQLSGAVGSADKDEARIANQVLDLLDDTVDGLSGLPKEARALWAAGKKSQTIESVVERAELAASGTENGLRTGFRQLLNNKKALRGFTEDEKAGMREIVNGTLGQKAMRLLGKAGPNRSGSAGFLGTAIGSGAGAKIGGDVGGPAGAFMGGVSVPFVGNAIGRAAEANALRNAEFLRALTAMGGNAPRQTTSRLATGTAGAGFPLAGTQLPTMTQPQSDQDKLARVLAAGQL
jgi:hypothetical protein